MRIAALEGPQVVRWIREELNSRIPIVFVTNRREERDMVEGLGCRRGRLHGQADPRCRIAGPGPCPPAPLLPLPARKPRDAGIECTVVEESLRWRVGFRDHGPGIPVELQSQLFQPFHCLKHEAHPDVHGVGLGLLLVRTVVQRHGGTVDIESAAGTGCTVTLVLPKPTAAEIEALAPTNKE